MRLTLLAAVASVALVLSVAPALAAVDAAITQSRQLIESGQAKAALGQLRALEATRAGDPDFDYTLGVAALEAGDPTAAIFALERALAVNPDFAAARAELARAYVAVGETKSARAELNRAQQGADAATQSAISRYLSDLDRIEGQRQKGGARDFFGGYGQIGFGYDSNVNAATDQTAFVIPAFAGFGLATLNPASREQDALYHREGLGIVYRHALSNKTALIANADVEQRLNINESEFDTVDFDAQAGLVHRTGPHTLGAAAQFGFQVLDSDAYRRSLGATGQYRYALSNNAYVGAFAQGARLDYVTQPIRDADRGALGLTYGRQFGGALAPTLGAAAYAAKEWERNNGVAHLGHTDYGVRVSGGLAFRPNLSANANLSYESRNYGGQEPLFLTGRDDDQYEAGLGLTWSPMEQVSVSPRVTYTKNSSNIILFDHDRWTAGVSLRRDF